MRPTCSSSSAGLLVALALAVASGCGTLTVPQERALGEEFSREVQREVTFLPDRVIQDYIDDIGQRIVRAAGPQPFEYRFYVIEDDEINAFAAPAGHIYIHTGTILAARNVSELTGVIAHEVGHVAKRHIAQNYGRARSTQIGQQALVLGASLLGGSAASGAANLLGGVAGVAYLNSFGRDAEREADAFAVEVMPAAGFDPEGLVTFFETLQQEGGSNVPTFLSSHPATDERIQNTQQLIEQSSLAPGLRLDDGGRLEIIQRRILLLQGRTLPDRVPASRSRAPEPPPPSAPSGPEGAIY